MSFEKLPISVMIPTLNAEGHLMELLDSIEPYVEDVFIVDSFSVDKTVDIALERKAKIVQRHYVTSSDQFQWMVDSLPVQTEWVFFMAQDERFSLSLVDSMRECFSRGVPSDINGYTVRWRLWFMGQPLHAMSDNLRLFRKGTCKISQVACNEHFMVSGKVGHLTGILDHKDTLTMHEWYEKQNLWTTREAIQRVKPPSNDELPRLLGTRRQQKAFLKQLLIHLPLGEMIFFWYYFLKFGAWRDGHAGWVWASLRVWVHHVTTLKEKEMRKYGIPQKLPEGRHGGFDTRVLASELQRQLLPETYCGSTKQ